MKSMIKEMWHGNIIPGEDGRNNSREMKELLGYMARHHEDLAKTFTNEQKEIFKKFHDCWDEYASLAEAAIFEYAFKLGSQRKVLLNCCRLFFNPMHIIGIHSIKSASTAGGWI